MAILLNEAEAGPFARAIIAADVAVIGAPTVLEVFLAIQRRQGPDGLSKAERFFEQGLLDVLDWPERLLPIARNALLAYGKGNHPARLNFGDCMAYALAKSHDAPLLYKGNDFAQTDIRSALAQPG